MPGRPSPCVLHPKGLKGEPSAVSSGNPTGDTVNDVRIPNPHLYNAARADDRQISPLTYDVPDMPVGMTDTPQGDLNKEIDGLIDDLGMNVDSNSMRNDFNKLNTVVLGFCKIIHSGAVQQEQPLTASALFDDGPTNRQYTRSLEGWKPGQLQSLSGLPLNNIHTSPCSSVTVHPPSTVASSSAPSVTREESKFDYLHGVGQQF